MEKNTKIVILVASIIFVICLVWIIVVLAMPKDEDTVQESKETEQVDETEYEDVYLDAEKYNKEVVLVSDQKYLLEESNSVVDDQSHKTNTSTALPLEKFILDDKIGIYGFSVMYDFEDCVLKYTIKNHTKTTVAGFKYRLQIVDSNGQIYGVVDLESKELPALSKYNVELTLDKDISSCYDIIPVTTFEMLGKNGGVYYENR